MRVRQMTHVYQPYHKRTPDSQYRDILRFILNEGELVKETPQGVGAITYIAPPSMHFYLKNGVPLITERDIPFWRKPIAEILGFVKGMRTLDELAAEGCDWWGAWATRKKCESMGLEAGDLGPGSYGPAFHNFPMPDGKTFNQFAHMIEQLKSYPAIRTHIITPWIPFYIGRGEGKQKAVVSPCHGWIHCRVLNGKLILHMMQRSADMPIGVPANMIQYAALTLMIAQVTGLDAYKYIHSFSDAHIYENQVKEVRTMLARKPRRLPSLSIDPNVTDLFSFTAKHCVLEDYDPHPWISIPVAV
jgi:thymidylate synthase